jgi:hypothetical protein
VSKPDKQLQETIKMNLFSLGYHKMKLSSSFTSLLSAASIAAARPTFHERGESVIRVPLTRKSATAVVGYVDLNVFKAQLIHVSKEPQDDFFSIEPRY